MLTQVLDQRKTLKSLYGVGPNAPVLVDVPALTVIAIDGVGDPAVSTTYQASVETLMSIAWTIRAHRKAQEPSQVLKVMPLEGHWSLPGIPFTEDPEVRAQLIWSLQIVQPEDLTSEELDAIRAVVRKKKPKLSPLDDVYLEHLPAGRAGTMLHVGPYATEAATIAKIHEAIEAADGEAALDHREIYLNDFRRTAPEKLKTILRVEVRRS